MDPEHLLSKQIEELKREAAELSRAYAETADALGINHVEAGRVLNSWVNIARYRPDMTWQDAYRRAAEELKERTEK
jgi:hypothetical protein